MDRSVNGNSDFAPGVLSLKYEVFRGQDTSKGNVFGVWAQRRIE
jgi:hypothetical protein